MNLQSTDSGEKLSPGMIVLFGSGETSASGRKIFDLVFRQLSQPPNISLVETPSGFEPNSEKVIGRVADFMCQHLQNYDPNVKMVPARKKGTAFSPDNPEILKPLLTADLIFMGPGSPTYAVNQLQNSLAWQIILASHYNGVCLVFASAATVAISKFALPVYEIYKVGEDLHWKPGLDFFSTYGLPLVIIPHWNNQDGGEELDTSHCFMGKARFAELMKLLPDKTIILGIDENTALIMNLEKGTSQVTGLGSVTLIIDQVTKVFPNGKILPLAQFLPFTDPEPGKGVPDEVWKQVIEVRKGLTVKRKKPTNLAVPESILALIEEREMARKQNAWSTADLLRNKIAEKGWQVLDGPEGPIIKQK